MAKTEKDPNEIIHLQVKPGGQAVYQRSTRPRFPTSATGRRLLRNFPTPAARLDLVRAGLPGFWQAGRRSFEGSGVAGRSGR